MFRTLQREFAGYQWKIDMESVRQNCYHLELEI